MSSNSETISPPGMPPMTTQPFPSGSNSVYTAGVVAQQNQAKLQTAASQLGGIKRHRRMRKSYRTKGGASIVVPSPPSYDPNKGASQDNLTNISALTASATQNATYDNTKNQADVSQAAAQNAQLYNTKGGTNKRKYHNKGGSLPAWSCLSGGKKSRKHRKTKRRKHRKTNRRRH